MTDNLWVEAASGEPVSTPPPPAGHRRRWPFVVVAILLLAGIYAWVARGGAAATANVLDVGSQRGGTKALMLASGVLDGAPYKVEWSEFPAAQNLLEAIGAGAVDIGLAGDAPFQFAYQSGQPVRAIGALASKPRPPGALDIVVPARSDIRDTAGLRGKRIATTRGSIGHYLLLRALEAAHLKPTDVQIVFLSPGDTKAAFDSGSIDAWSTWSPYVPTVLASGGRILTEGSDYVTGYAFDAANGQSVVAKKALLTDFLQREARAYVWAKGHPQAYARVLAHETGLPLAIALYHVEHMPLARVPIDEALKSEERDVVARFRSAGALAGAQPLDAAYVPLDQGNSHGD